MSFFLSKKRFLFIAIVVLLAAGGAWYYYSQYLPAQASPPAETIKTAWVRRGDLVITAGGTGILVPATEVNLSFSSGGLLAELLVDVGDQVEAGQVLARLYDSDARLQVTQAEIDLRLAELELAELTGDPEAADLAAAQADLVAAQADLDSLTTPPTAEELAAARENLISAQQALADLLDGPSPEEIAVAKADLRTAEITLQEAQAEYDKVAWRAGASASSQAMTLWQATTDYEKARANYDLAVAGSTENEIAAARAAVAQAQDELNALEQGPDSEDLAAAQAKVAQAQAQLDALLAGASSEELETAQLSVEQAGNNLASAQADLEDAVLKAPFAAIVTACEANVGEVVGTDSVITLADLTYPLIELYLDEADLDKIEPGYEVEVVFDALPDETFTGHVVRVDPALVEIENVPTVQGLAVLEEEQLGNSRFLPAGLNASVEVIAGRAENALLVPVEALRELSPGEYAVFVVVDGQLQARSVEVGLMDYAYAEITSGLQEGDQVSTGIVETK